MRSKAPSIQEALRLLGGEIPCRVKVETPIRVLGNCPPFDGAVTRTIEGGEKTLLEVVCHVRRDDVMQLFLDPEDAITISNDDGVITIEYDRHYECHYIGPHKSEHVEMYKDYIRLIHQT